MTMPNFLIIGAGKAGTTALYRYLEQHPQVYMSPVKETSFFALEGKPADFRSPEAEERINCWSVTNLEDYRRLFDGVSGEKAVGEASPLYLYSSEASEQIKHHVPEAKLIAILRNPADRAHSAFAHMVRDGLENFTDFSRALEEEQRRIEENWSWIWHYKQMGFYHEQLHPYFDAFDRDQIRTYLYEDLNADPTSVLRDAFDFLGVDTGFTPDTAVRYNRSGVPKNKWLHSFLMRSSPIKAPFKTLIPTKTRKRMVANLRNRNLRKPPELAPSVRRRLAEDYRPDILKLQDLIQRDLSNWL